MSAEGQRQSELIFGNGKTALGWDSLASDSPKQTANMAHFGGGILGLIASKVRLC